MEFQLLNGEGVKKTKSRWFGHAECKDYDNQIKHCTQMQTDKCSVKRRYRRNDVKNCLRRFTKKKETKRNKKYVLWNMVSAP